MSSGTSLMGGSAVYREYDHVRGTQDSDKLFVCWLKFKNRRRSRAPFRQWYVHRRRKMRISFERCA